MDDWIFGQLDNWTTGELENWRAGELEDWRVRWWQVWINGKLVRVEWKNEYGIGLNGGVFGSLYHWENPQPPWNKVLIHSRRKRILT
ncbi:MAG: hypothetical protein HWD92_09485 [Flavobacteriia bacterium]|nr:hypothetical protein [Flavobacteriia bacterium]